MRYTGFYSLSFEILSVVWMCPFIIYTHESKTRVARDFKRTEKLPLTNWVRTFDKIWISSTSNSQQLICLEMFRNFDTGMWTASQFLYQYFTNLFPLLLYIFFVSNGKHKLYSINRSLFHKSKMINLVVQILNTAVRRAIQFQVKLVTILIL